MQQCQHSRINAGNMSNVTGQLLAFGKNNRLVIVQPNPGEPKEAARHGCSPGPVQRLPGRGRCAEPLKDRVVA